MKLADISIQEEGRMNEFKILLFMSDDFMVPHCSTNICHFRETNRVNVICLPYLHPSVLVSFPVMAVVSSLTLQRDSSPQHYRPDRRTHCDLQLLWLQGHLDHNHSWTLSIRLYISLSLALSWCMLRAFGINLLLLHIYILPALSSSRCKLSTWTPSLFHLWMTYMRTSAPYRRIHACFLQCHWVLRHLKL